MKTMATLSVADASDDVRGHFTFIDLFAGIGGIERGLSPLGAPAYSAQWDRFAQQTYHANYRDNRPLASDITQLPADEIPEHDVLLAGFPCQPFST